ncbi:C2 calcium-dependent domain-containing protein 4A-like [Xyrichtys novacula]|uniref:C2 calcium-dependent domain-containing protein 4A-like n=1 Tax=Xyrichtys novacula TaxID=13765 RepID=A0AAV1HEA9_XYRNO|nr:C2 calcium-dependent domain-containing protein 4A-like [Xyrichtys novacula]
MSSLRSLVLTPERIPSFFVPSRSPLLSPRPRRISPDRTRLLSDHVEESPESRPHSDAQSRGTLLLPTPRVRRPRPSAAESTDVDLTTRAALSLPHVGKMTTPYGFSAALAASPCTSRRESLFHRRSKLVTVTVTDSDPHKAEAEAPPPSPVGTSRSRVRAFGLQVIEELKRPAAILKALSPAQRR